MPDMPPQIAILLASYQGARHIAAQLDSLAAQLAEAGLASWDSSAPDPRLIVGLDVRDAEAARRMVERLGDAACFYKIGLGLLASGGLDLAFLPAEAPALGAFVRFGVRFDPPPLPVPGPPAAPKAPGGDPARPPILRQDRARVRRP